MFYNFDQIKTFLKRSLTAFNFVVVCFNFVFTFFICFSAALNVFVNFIDFFFFNFFTFVFKFLIFLINVLFAFSKTTLIIKSRRAAIWTFAITIAFFMTLSSYVFARKFLLSCKFFVKDFDHLFELTIYSWNKFNAKNMRRAERRSVVKSVFFAICATTRDVICATNEAKNTRNAKNASNTKIVEINEISDDEKAAKLTNDDEKIEKLIDDEKIENVKVAVNEERHLIKMIKRCRLMTEKKDFSCRKSNDSKSEREWRLIVIVFA